MHRSSLVQENFNYWTKLCHECIWKADAATRCVLALPRQGSKKGRKLESERQAETEGVHITWSIWFKSRKYFWILRRQRTWRHLKWNHILFSPSASGVVEALAASTVTITSLSIDAASPRASLLVYPPIHCFPREGPAGFIHTLGRHCASDSDQEKNVPDPGLVNFFTHCCTGHTVSDIGTLELLKHNVHRRLSVLQASLSVFGPLYGNVWQQDHLFVACVCMSPISTEGSCKAKSSGTFIHSAPK